MDLAHRGDDAEHLGREIPYDAVVLDLGLPVKPGLQILRDWRKDHITLPVIILTARNAWQEKVEGFKAGADDYLTKPFHFEELLARLRAVLRRSHTQEMASLDICGLQLDEDRQMCRVDNQNDVELTGTEFRLLRYFMSHPGKLLSKSRLTEHVYEFEDERDSNVIEAYVTRLRQKIGRDRIQTKRGQGYIFCP